MRISHWSSDVCSSDLRVLQRPPVSSLAKIEPCRDGSQRIQRLFLAVNARSCTQHITPELRLPFIDPQQRIAHWRTEIRRRKSHRPAIFAVPAMRQFMGQDVASARPLVPTCEIFGRHAIFGTAMVLQTNTPEFIAESPQKIVMIEMFGSEQVAGWSDQFLE